MIRQCYSISQKLEATERWPLSQFDKDSAPQVGLEPTTLRLTAECSAIELLRNKRPHIVNHHYVQGAKRFL